MKNSEIMFKPRALFPLLVGFASLVLAGLPCGAAPDAPELKLPRGTKFINGTGQLPIIGTTFKAPGFTSQGYIEIRENAGPNLYFIGLNAADVPLTIRNSFKTSYNGALTRITYRQRNKELALPNGADETVAGPWQFYVSDPMPLSVKAGDELYLRTFVPLSKDTSIGCGIISGSMARPDGRWPYGNVVSGDDLTLDPDLETKWKPNSDFLYTPFLVAGEGVRKDARFIVAFGDSLTFQVEKDANGTWFQSAFRDTPHANLAIGGDALVNLFTPEGQLSGPMQQARFQVAQYATDVVNFYGHNDLGNGRPVADMLRLDQEFCARPELKNVRKWRITLTPFTHLKKGADLATLTPTDQTPDQWSNNIIEYNKDLRRDYGKLGYDGLLDFGALLATGPDSPYWKPNMAQDGTHFGRHPANEMLAPEARKVLATQEVHKK